MRKLSKAEIDALAAKLHRNLEEQAELAQDQLNAVQDKTNRAKLKEQLADAQIAVKAIAKLPKKNRDALTYFFGEGNFKAMMSIAKITEAQITDRVHHMRKKQTMVRVPSDPSYRSRWEPVNELVQELTIAQIDSDNIDQLLSKAARRFVKTPGAGKTK